MEDAWLTWAKRLQSIASTGLHFGKDRYDRQRYEEIGHIANEMLGRLGSVPIERIESLVSDFAKGYATPKVDVRGAVFQESRILLVREASDGLWALPGGFADVGMSASENVVKEVQEEASLRVAATRLFALRHKAKHSYPPDPRDFYKLLFLCEPIGEVSPQPGADVTEVGFFGLEDLPPLSMSRTITDDVTAAFASRNESTGRALFD
ncbi:MAG TPA: NUDIX hydrolase [Vicinamibacterales bacterium]|nr:NUDIX hydrolase [Vicinamibacterales bacterium]